MGLKKIKKEDHAPVNSMKGLFVIVKGQYSKTAPAVTCRDGEDRFIGGYNPADEHTSEWYQLMDRVTFQTISCGSSIDQLINRLTKTIVYFNNDKDRYLSRFNTTYEDDTGRLSKRVTVSPITRMMLEKVVEFYGDYFDDIISDAEEKAFKELAQKPKKTVKKIAVVKDTPTPKNTIKMTKESPKKTLVKKKSSPAPKTKPKKDTPLAKFSFI